MQGNAWRLLLTGHSDGRTNMALDRALLHSKGAVPSLRLYGWKPWTLSLGYFQKEDDFDLESYCAQGYGVVRRITGGSAVFHAEEITFSIALAEDNPWIPRRVPDSYRAVHEAVRLGLRRLGVEARFRDESCATAEARGRGFCFDDPAACDLLVDDKKIAGSAQRRSGGRILHHGSIVLRPNPITPTIASVEESGGTADFRKAERAIAEGFEERFGIRLVEAEPGFEELALEEEFRAG